MSSILNLSSQQGDLNQCLPWQLQDLELVNLWIKLKWSCENMQLEIKLNICCGREIPPLHTYSTDMHAHVCPEKYTSSTITALFVLSPNWKQSTYASRVKWIHCILQTISNENFWKRKNDIKTQKHRWDSAIYWPQYFTLYNSIYRNCKIQNKLNCSVYLVKV